MFDIQTEALLRSACPPDAAFHDRIALMLGGASLILWTGLLLAAL